MILNNHLIATLPDFARHFSFSEFWLNRKQFVRDLSPDKVYYWDEQLKEAYTKIKVWIEQDDADKHLRDEGVEALRILLGGKLDMESVHIMEGTTINMTQDIIYVQAGQTLNLPPCQKVYTEKAKLRLHKIEVYGMSSLPTTITIGKTVCGALKVGEAVYVSEIAGGCIELLPNHLRNGSLDLSLLSQPGEFASTLVVQDQNTDSRMMFDGVVSFALVDDGYIYIDRHHKPVYMMTAIPKFMLKHDADALIVKAQDHAVMILYSDGVLKSTTSLQPIKNVFYPKFDPKGNIITNHLL